MEAHLIESGGIVLTGLLVTVGVWLTLAWLLYIYRVVHLVAEHSLLTSS